MNTTISPDTPITLLGGLSPAQFMRRYWHKKPLLVRQAVPQFAPPVGRDALFALAAREEVESRLLEQRGGAWKLRHGPLARRALPALSRSHWTLLVQGVNLHDAGVHRLMQQFRFVPDARLDDLMISYATDGGGVGPHFDSYDVFLLQAHGRRRWRIGRERDTRLVDGLPLRILAHFEPEEEWLLEPGDMLYLPPRWAHDGIAEGECMTYSIGFRSPARGELARELLPRLLDEADESENARDPRYRDPRQPAVQQPAAIPGDLQAFARDALQRALDQPLAMERALGEYLSEPKPRVWFEPGAQAALGAHGVRLDARTRMLYDASHIFINGESLRAAGRDATLMRKLANQRWLDTRDLARASPEALQVLATWCEDGWAHPEESA